MRLGLSHPRKKRNRFAAAFIVLVIFVVLFFTILVKLQPAFLAYASVYANNIANNIVNESVNNVFSDSSYASLTEIKSGSENTLKTIETDAVKVNKLKTALNQSIQNNIKDFRGETIRMPLGSATSFYFLAGLGPEIPVRVYPVSMVNTDFREEFDSAGINQVYHRLYLDVSIEMSFVGMTFAQTETVSTSALLSETVIVGDTPQYYGNGSVSASVK